MKQKITMRRRIILATVSSVTTALICCGAFFIYQIYATTKSNVIARTNESIDQISLSMNTKLMHLENSSFAFLATSTLRQWNNREITFQNDNYPVINELKAEISSNLMFNTSWLSKYIEAIYLFADDQTIQLATRIPSYHNRIHAQFEEVFDAIAENGENSFFTILDQQGAPQVYMIRRMHDVTATKQLTLIYWLNVSILAEDLAGHDPGYAYYVLYEDTVLLAEDNTVIGTKIDLGENAASVLDNGFASQFNDHGQMEVRRPLSTAPFSVYVAIPRQVVMEPAQQTVLPYILIVAGFVLVFGLLAGLFATTYTRFIAHLAKGIAEVRSSNFSVELPPTNDRELAVISTAFNEMAAEIQRLIDNVYRTELLLKDADIRLLQSQINPHFLVNTLTTIGTRAMLNGDGETYEMTSSLSSMITSSMYNTSEHSQFITLERELEYVKCYLKLQKIRFSDQLNFRIHIPDEGLRGLYIPRLSVEPLVENAVIHGVADNLAGGVVEITACREDDQLLIQVMDNGQGFDAEEALSKVSPPNGRGHRIGLANTNKRLQLLFGSAYGISFTFEAGTRTTAHIRVPIMETDPGGQEAKT